MKFVTGLLLATTVVCLGQVAADKRTIGKVILMGNGQLQCMAHDGSACSARHVDLLKAMILTRTQNRSVDTNSLALVDKDGTLRCKSKSGAPCAAVEAAEIEQALGQSPASK